MSQLHKIKVEQFEGPLDLLLQLVEDQKLEITKVSLTQVTEQYIQILNQSVGKKVTSGELADFLVVATRLLLIKSRALLPFLEWEKDEGEDLSKQLKIYKEYLDASKVVASMIGQKNFSFARAKLWTVEAIGFAPPSKLTSDKLTQILTDVIAGLEPYLNLPTEVVRRTIDIQEKIQQIRDKISSQVNTSFSEILKEAKDKTEIIVSFLALLELIKQKTIVVKQNKIFDDITVERLNQK